MSSATKALNINNQYTTLWLIGGYDCNPEFNPFTSASATNVDLRVLGGVEIYKRMCVTGNIMTPSLFIGNVCAPQIYTDDLFDKTGNGITINANIMFDPSSVLFVNKACINELQVNTIENKPNESDIIIMPTGNILLCSTNQGKVFVCNDMYIAGNVNLNDKNLSNVNVVQSNSTISNTIVSNTMTTNIITSNTLCVLGNIVGDNIKPKTGTTVNVQGNFVISGNVSAQNLTGNMITVWVGNATSNLNMNCYVISNVMAMHVNDVYGKLSPEININDTLNMISGTKIVWGGGIEIGNINTITSSSDSIAIGKDANASVPGSIALGPSITSTQAGFFVKHRLDTSISTPAGWIGDELVDVTSSRRYKENIRDLEAVSDKIQQIRPVRFNAKKEYAVGHEHEQIGLIAEELYEIFPEFIVMDEDQVTPKGIAFDRMVSIVIKELQCLRKDVSKLKEVNERQKYEIRDMQNVIELLLSTHESSYGVDQRSTPKSLISPDDELALISSSILDDSSKKDGLSVEGDRISPREHLMQIL